MIEYTVKVSEDGGKRWYVDDKLHRLDGPAIECTDGYQAWYFNDELHRLDGPAIEFTHGDKEWYKHGLFHREDGPALEYANGTKEWYLNGEQLTEEEFNRQSQSCDGKIVTIDGKEYKLTEV